MPRIVTVWKHPTTGMLYFDALIPRDKRAQAGQDRYRRTMDTRSRQAAARLHGDFEARYRAWLDGLGAPAQPLTTRQVSALTGIWYRSLLSSLGDNPGAVATWERVSSYFAAPSAIDALKVSRKPPELRIDEAAVSAEVNRLLEGERLRVDAPSLAALTRSLGQHVSSLADDLWRMRGGDFSDSRQAQMFAVWVPPEPPKAAAISIKGLFTAMVKGREDTGGALRPSTVYDYGRYVGMLIDYLGHDDASKVTPQVAREWRNALIASRRYKARSINDGPLAAARSTFADAIDAGRLKIEANPFSGVRARINDLDDADGEDKQYTEEQAASLLVAARSAPVWIRWSVWIMAYSGCRLGECISLHRADVQTEGGIPFLNFGQVVVAEGSRRSRKTRGARRRVPLHPALIREGFLQYVQSLPAGSRLLPDAPRGRAARESSKASQLMGQWTKAHVKRTAHQRPSHAWRHRFTSRLRDGGVSDDTARHLTGHARGKGVTSAYGGPEGLKRLATVLAMGTFPDPG